jgi:hypothetical protein
MDSNIIIDEANELFRLLLCNLSTNSKIPLELLNRVIRGSDDISLYGGTNENIWNREISFKKKGGSTECLVFCKKHFEIIIDLDDDLNLISLTKNSINFNTLEKSPHYLISFANKKITDGKGVEADPDDLHYISNEIYDLCHTFYQSLDYSIIDGRKNKNSTPKSFAKAFNKFAFSDNIKNLTDQNERDDNKAFLDEVKENMTPEALALLRLISNEFMLNAMNKKFDKTEESYVDSKKKRGKYTIR